MEKYIANADIHLGHYHCKASQNVSDIVIENWKNSGELQYRLEKKHISLVSFEDNSKAHSDKRKNKEKIENDKGNNEGSK